MAALRFSKGRHDAQAVPQRRAGGVLDDLRRRLELTRWPDQLEGQGWRLGTERGFLQRLCAYWAAEFDWRAQEARLNTLPQFRTAVDGVGLHLVHARSEASDATPLLLANG